jgi:preprotein translocase subunit SecB
MKKKTNIALGTDASYKKFLENVELMALGLDSLDAGLKRRPYSDAVTEKEAKVIREIKTGFAITSFSKDHFDVSAIFTLTIGMKSDDALLSIKAEFSAHIHAKKGSFAKSDAEKFAQSEARLMFWPYFRQTVSDLTARMHIRPLTIPLTFRS